MEQQQSPDATEVDELLTVLANQECRAIVGYFQDTSEDVASIDDLLSQVRDGEPDEGDSREKQSVATRLHHSTLPRLEDTGIIDYDVRSRTVRYRGHPLLETLADDGMVY